MTRKTDAELMPFVECVRSFYGAGGIYSMDALSYDIMKATRRHISKAAIPFEGDTVDREAVRDILIDDFGYHWPNASRAVALPDVPLNP